MQISLKWINELVNVEIINLDNLINKLTLGGFEVEEIIEVEINNKKTIALDISATANRSDSLSIQGLSLELAALLNYVPKLSNYSIKTFSWSEKFKNQLKNTLINPDCSGFIAISIEKLNTLLPPKWLQEKLIASGIIPKNNLQDFQNYILLETGYPFECYDLDKISSTLSTSDFNLSLTHSHNSEKFIANNGIKYILDPSLLIVRANNLPISIAGIIPNNDVSYSERTKSLLIEGSIFNAAKIRQQSRTIGLRTDRSARYEKSLKNTDLLASFHRLITLLRVKNPTLKCKLHTLTKFKEENARELSLSYQNVIQILGPIQKSENNEYKYISSNRITESLIRLKFDVKYNPQRLIWQVSIPALRGDDIVQEIDLIEEIGRIYGFDNFLTRLPIIKAIGNKDFDYQIRKKLTTCLINLGLNELIQYSLVSQKTYIENEVKLINPLVKDYSNLRTSLLPNLLKMVEKNLKKNNSVLEGFEYGHVFSGTRLETIYETEYISGIFGGAKVKSNWTSSTEILEWTEAKGRIEYLFQRLNLNINWKEYKPIKEGQMLHPYRTATIILKNGIKLGIFGQINPLLAKKLTIPTDVYLFEFNFELIKDQIQQNKLPVYKEYAAYPKIVKDLSFVIEDTISFRELKEILYLNGSQFLTNITLVDEYSGESIPNNHISLCLQLTFQSNKKTLLNKTVENIMENLKNVLISKFNILLRI